MSLSDTSGRMIVSPRPQEIAIASDYRLSSRYCVYWHGLGSEDCVVYPLVSSFAGGKCSATGPLKFGSLCPGRAWIHCVICMCAGLCNMFYFCSLSSLSMLLRLSVGHLHVVFPVRFNAKVCSLIALSVDFPVELHYFNTCNGRVFTLQSEDDCGLGLGLAELWSLWSAVPADVI
eukprot:6178813-Pleurochrysis_carterae.AAC.1